MKRKTARYITSALMALSLVAAMVPAFATDLPQALTACYPTAVTRSEDGSEIRKMYDLSPEDDPAGIPRSDFDQDGYHYTLIDLLKQELPENESRQHTETVTLSSKSKDMATVLTLLPQTREFITEDGLSGTLALQLGTVKVAVAGYSSSTKELTATRSYPGLASQDTSPIPKEIEDDGHTLALQSIDWQRAGETGEDGSERYTAMASYTGSTTNSYIKGYTVTADYTGTVSRIALNRTRYVAIYEGTSLEPQPQETRLPADAPDTSDTDTITQQKNMTVPIAIAAILCLGGGAFLLIQRRRGR